MKLTESKRIPRIYYSSVLDLGKNVILDSKSSNHVLNVLRLKTGNFIKLFNENEGEFLSEIVNVTKQKLTIEIKKFINEKAELESPIKIHLAQSVSCGEKMDYTIQKSVELGVNKITPIFTERCNVKLKGKRLESKVNHWKNVITSACEQCGRNFVPKIDSPINLDNWLIQERFGCCLTLYHASELSFKDLKKSPTNYTILVGPEGGLTQIEVKLSEKYGFIPIKLGPRTLRTETAALVAISILQSKWGDF